MVCGRLALTIRKKWILSRKGNGYRCPPELVEALNVRQQDQSRSETGLLCRCQGNLVVRLKKDENT